MKFIETIKQNDLGFKEYQENLEGTKKEHPDMDFGIIDYKKVNDYMMPYLDYLDVVDYHIVDDKNAFVDINNVFVAETNWQHRFEQLTLHQFKEKNYFDSEISYGVCDNAEQLIAHANELNLKGDKYLLVLEPIIRNHQSYEGGWRWCKNGEYIGVQDPQFEYLYDDEDIDLVFQFKIYELLK